MVEEPKPCRKFRKADAAEFFRHINDDKCPKCLALFRYFERESQIAEALRRNRN
jgi:hypothetical protein